MLMNDNVNVMRLQLESNNSVGLRSVTNVSMMPPISLAVGVTDMTWCENGLYVATPNKVYVLCCDTVIDDNRDESRPLPYHVEVVHLDYHR